MTNLLMSLTAAFISGGMTNPGDLLPLGPPAGSHVISGNFTHYAQSPTDGTLDYRQDIGQLPESLWGYTVYLATIETCDVGATGWIRPVYEHGPGEWERFVVFDCAGHAETVDGFFRPNRVIGEIDYYTAMRWNTIGHGIGGEIVWINED